MAASVELSDQEHTARTGQGEKHTEHTGHYTRHLQGIMILIKLAMIIKSWNDYDFNLE